MSGVVTAVEAEAGQVVTAGMTVARIAQDGPRDVVFSVAEDRVAGLRVGADVAVRLWASAQAVGGKVREVAAGADPVTRTYLVKVSLDPAAQPPLGATAYVSPAASASVGVPVIKLPTTALRQEGQGSAVWVLDRSTMTVRSQPVQVAAADGNDVVIAGGLQPGTSIVAAGVHVLTPGQKVAIYQEKTFPGAAAGAAAGGSGPAPVVATRK